MHPAPSSRTRRARSWSLAIVLWAFGLATSTLLVGLWGRTVSNDQSSLERSTRAAISSEVVTDRIDGWIADAIAGASGEADPEISDVVQLIAQSPEVAGAIDRIVADIVDAALAEPGTEATVEIGAAFESVAPVVVAELSARGIVVPAESVDGAIATASAVVLDTGQATSIVGAVYRARSLLTTVLVASLAALVTFASLAIALADEHLAMVRTLTTRLAVSALTFTVLLRLGAWAIDPNKGRSSLTSGGSVLLGSNHLALFLVAGAALTASLSVGIIIRNRRVNAHRVVDREVPDEIVADRQLATV
jgi:hypothetical protein